MIIKIGQKKYSTNNQDYLNTTEVFKDLSMKYKELLQISFMHLLICIVFDKEIMKFIKLLINFIKEKSPKSSLTI